MFARYIRCFTVYLLLLSSFTVAQDVPVIVIPQDESSGPGYYVGGGLGLFVASPAVYAYLGYAVPAEKADYRVSLEGSPWPLPSLRMSADYIYRPSWFYLGGGLRVWYLPDIDLNYETDLDLSVAVLGGVSFSGDTLDYFFELELTHINSVADFAAFIPLFALKVGLSYPL